MDLFQHRYYRLNKTLLTLLGYWPYQSTRLRVTLSVILFFGLATQVVPQTIALSKYRVDPRIIFESVIIFLFEMICAIKGISWVLNVQKTLKLLNCIRTDWQLWAGDREMNILHEYAEQGRKMTIAYTAGMNAAIIIYVTQPIIPTIIDVLLKNGTAIRKFPYPVDFYYFDAQKHYWYIIIHIYVCSCSGIIIMVATEAMLIIFVQHVCGIFAALGLKLQRVGNNDAPLKSGGIPCALDTVDLPSYIDKHNDAIRFVNLIDATYTWNIFFVTGLCIILINAIGIQILLAKNDAETTVRSVGVELGTILQLYVACEISEILMDHSIIIHSNVHKSRWYNLTPEAQRSLQLMMMLCRIPCRLTAGKYVTLSIRFCGQAIRTAMSYFTFVRSIRQ